MEEFEDMKSTAFNASDAPNAHNATTTIKRYKYETASQNGQIMHQLKEKLKKNRLKSAKVLKAINEIAAKQLRIWQKTEITRAGKIIETAVKKIAIQKLQMEKARIEE